MNETELKAMVRRVMDKVDFYLHCELDDEYAHEGPALARAQLEDALQDAIRRAQAIGVVSNVSRKPLAESLIERTFQRETEDPLNAHCHR